MSEPWLVFDASAKLAVAAVFSGDDCLGERRSSVQNGHGPALLVLLDELLREAGLDKPARLVVGCGPGSFTGIRVALATALGLRRAWQVPVITVTSFEVLAVDQRGAFWTTVPALPGEVYAQRWSDDSTEGEPLVLAEHELPTGAVLVSGELSARALLRAAQRKAPSAELLPCYVAPPKITLPKSKT